MPKITLLTYANKNYYSHQKRLVARARELGAIDDSIQATRDQLIKTDFYKEHQEILDQERGSGYWLWKPYFIYEALKNMSDGDVLIYLDSGDWISCSFRNHIDKWSQRFVESPFIFTDGSSKQAAYCKRDTFISMEMDEYQYQNTQQLEAGMIVIKNCEYARRLILEWMICCFDYRLLTDAPNELGGNLPEFIDHRHDQSILTLIVRRRMLPSGSEMRQFINGNQNPENFGQ